MADDLVYLAGPDPLRPFIKPGVTKGWIVIRTDADQIGEAIPAVALADDEGVVFLTGDGAEP